MSTNMKRICVIGLGQFGRELAVNFARHAEVLAIDVNQTLVNQIADDVHRAYTLDARDYAGLASVVNKDFDEAIVSVGENMESSILAVLHLKKIGVPRVHAKAKSKDHAQILEAVGADNIIFPERDTARRLVRQVLNPNLLDFVPISEDYSVMHLSPPKEFWGKALKDLDLRKRFGIFVIAVKEFVPERTTFLPGPDSVIQDDMILIVIGRPDALQSMSALRPAPVRNGESPAAPHPAAPVENKADAPNEATPDGGSQTPPPKPATQSGGVTQPPQQSHPSAQTHGGKRHK
jgi:trk system potassium uptake protein TrkA